MAKYIMFGDYCEDVEVKRAPFREEHLKHLRQLKEEGMLDMAGPTKDLKNIFAIFSGENENDIIREIESDPYWKNGIWTAFELKEWIDAV